MTAYLIGLTGIPGSGKSHFARSAASVGPTAVAIIDPKEEAFYKEQLTAQHVLNAHVLNAMNQRKDDRIMTFADLEWRPHVDQYNATGFRRLLEWVSKRADDDSQFVVVDPMSEVSDLALHEVLKMHATNDPSDLAHGRAYTGHDQQMKQLLTELRRCVARGKTVICTFHGKMKELEGVGDPKKTKGMSGEMEWKFDEQMLPVLNTSLRQSIHSPFNLWLYTVPVGFGPGRKFYVTAIADAVRPAKHSVTFKAGVNQARIPNTVKELLDGLEG